MPELPEVETVTRGIASVWTGRRFTGVECRRPDLRRPLPADLADRLTGATVTRLWRRAKYMLADLDQGDHLLVHLGMSGTMAISMGRNEPPGKHDHVLFTTQDGTLVTFRDPRRFGLIDLIAGDPLAHPLLAGLGPEPLADSFTPELLSRALKGRQTPIKVALLDQTVVAGLGNIYASECLYLAGIHPTRAACDIKPREMAKLVPAIKEVLTRAIQAGGSSLKDHVRPDGELGYFQHQFSVYGRDGERCPKCTCRNGVIEKITQSGRSTFLCAKRQR